MYQARYSQTFSDHLRDPRFSGMLQDIKRKTEMIMQQPYTAAKSEKLKYNWARKRSARVDDRFRLIYKICEECEKRSEGEPNHMTNCLSCDEIPATTVNFLDITDHYH